MSATAQITLDTTPPELRLDPPTVRLEHDALLEVPYWLSEPQITDATLTDETGHQQPLASINGTLRGYLPHSLIATAHLHVTVCDDVGNQAEYRYSLGTARTGLRIADRPHTEATADEN